MANYDEDIPFTGEYLDFAGMSRDELQAKLFELLTLVETSRELLRATDPEDVARRVLLSSIGVLGASSASVLFRDPAHERLALVQHLGLEVEDLPPVPLPEALAEAFLQTEEPRPFRVDEELAAGPARSFLRSYQETLTLLDAAVICPLADRKELVGFLVLGRRLLAEGYSARDLELFASLAELYVLALGRAHPPTPPRTRPAATGAAGSRSQEETRHALVELRDHHPPLREILGESEAILRLLTDLVEFANSRATILILGESGTGKELIAKAIHALSNRRSGPLEVIDCSSIPKELIESELFGHVRGAFTGAVRDRRGAFDLAHKGTLFLDEIGDMTLPSQTRLLRVLQEGKFRPVGGEKTHSVDVRVIAATNVDLQQAVTQGRFRKDLFYRIQVFPLRLPPLRERQGDVEVLARTFLKRFYADFGLPEPEIDAEVLMRLSTHAFPGNVRELQNIAEALAIRSRGEGRVRLFHLEAVFQSQRITEAHAPRPMPSPPAPEIPPEPPPVDMASTAPATGRQVVDAWRSCGFNLLEASRQLRARRLDGELVPVVDRAQLSHYLDGEILRLFLEGGSRERVRDALAQGAPGGHRAVRRVGQVLQRLRGAARAGELEQAFPRLPHEYHEVLDRLVDNGPEWIETRLR